MKCRFLCVAGTDPVMGVSKGKQQGSPNCSCPGHSFFFIFFFFHSVLYCSLSPDGNWLNPI